MGSKGWQPAPVAGDIVDCRFPEEEFEQPGPKTRPALVLHVEESIDSPGGYVVTVAYATSQNTKKVYPGEFVIKGLPGTGLTKDTKFDLVTRHRLPFDGKWFESAAGTKPAHPCRGRLDLTDSTSSVNCTRPS